MSLQERDVLIVGAGPTGLGAAWRINELVSRQRINPAIDWLLTEQAAGPGGMAASVTDAEGFTWDLGGHIIYSHYEYFDAVLAEVMNGGMLQHPRKSWVWMLDRFIPFPIQHNLRHLPAGDLARCLRDLVAASQREKRNDEPVSFADWLADNFGAGLCELFFFPYNLKMWAHPAEELSTVWTHRKSGSRYANVPLVDIARLVENVVVGRDDPGWAGATTFPYPRQGGIGALWLRVFERLPRHRVALRERLVGVDPDQRIAHFAGGLKVRYRHLISSAPLPELLKLMPAASYLRREETPLRHSCTHSIGFGVRGTMPKILEDKYWIYVPEPAAPYFRVTVVSNFSRNNAPTDEPSWSIACETSSRPEEGLDSADLIAWAERSLRASFLPPEQTIVSRWYRRLSYGYPLPCLDRDRFLQEIQPVLHRAGILARGRLGGWKYETSNQDNAFMQGVEAVDSVLFGTEEMSYFHLDEVTKGSVKRRLSEWEPRKPWLQGLPRSVA